MTSHLYDELMAHNKHIRWLESTLQLLSWDQETYMPSGSGEARSEQIEALASLIHREKTNTTYVDLLSKVVDIDTGIPKSNDLNQIQRVSLKWLHRDYRKQSALPNQFVKTFAKLSSQAQLVWAEARKEDRFSLFLPYLTQMVDMNRQKATYLAPHASNLYDALLDEFEPFMTVQKLDPLFLQLGKELSILLEKIMLQPPKDSSPLHGQFPVDKQLEFSHLLLEKIGFNLDYGRLDLSTHPFSSSMHPTDCRITTRIHPSSLFDCFSSVLHEAGHGLYEMGLPQEYFGTPIGDPVSLSIHESQSRFWETFIGQSQGLWKLLFPKLTQYFPNHFDTVNFSKFYQAINSVSPSLIRVEADEITYCLHILVRYEIEKGLISGQLHPRDVPNAWTTFMKAFVGKIPDTDREGCLQDIHWSMGAFGYFPTYALGNLYAGQFFASFERKYPQWETRIQKEENLHFITAWLHEAIHQHGHLYTSEELCTKVTGEPLSEKYYLKYLNNKYLHSDY